MVCTTEIPPGCPLFGREYEVAVLLSEGLDYPGIAARLGLSVSTVRSAAERARLRLEVHTAAELVARIFSEGWGPSSPDRARAELAEERLAMLVEKHVEEAQARLTPGQAVYVRAFMRWLREPDSSSRAIERALCLRAMFYEARVIPPWEVLGRPHRTGPARAVLVNRRPPKVFPVRF